MESRLTQGTPRDSMIRFATVVFPDALPPARPGVCVWRERERKERRGERGRREEERKKGRRDREEEERERCVLLYDCVLQLKTTHL